MTQLYAFKQITFDVNFQIINIMILSSTASKSAIIWQNLYCYMGEVRAMAHGLPHFEPNAQPIQTIALLHSALSKENSPLNAGMKFAGTVGNNFWPRCIKPWVGCLRIMVDDLWSFRNVTYAGIGRKPAYCSTTRYVAE